VNAPYSLFAPKLVILNRRTKEEKDIRNKCGLDEMDVAASLGATSGADAEKIRAHAATIRRFGGSPVELCGGRRETWL
jgi:hypothetical protein